MPPSTMMTHLGTKSDSIKQQVVQYYREKYIYVCLLTNLLILINRGGYFSCKISHRLPECPALHEHYVFINIGNNLGS